MDSDVPAAANKWESTRDWTRTFASLHDEENFVKINNADGLRYMVTSSEDLDDNEMWCVQECTECGLVAVRPAPVEMAGLLDTHMLDTHSLLARMMKWLVCW